ncbi:hypothetical protein Hanom_Chr11g01035341 [Helianthus anomalus]
MFWAMVLARVEPEMSPRAARRLATRVRREWEREKREWKVEGVGMGRGVEEGSMVISRMRVRKRTGGDFGVPMAMGFGWKEKVDSKAVRI